MPEAGAAVPDYDRIWDEVYGDLQDLGPTHRHMQRLMRAAVTPLSYASVLDIGVGFGHNLPGLTGGRRIERLGGVDISERALEHVRGRWSGDFRKLDITTGHLPETYELICCALVLEHLFEDEAALRNIRAMSSRYLLVTTIGGRFERYRPWEEQVGHVRNYSEDELERKLAAAGFSLIQMVRWGFPFYSPLARTLQNRMTATHEFSASSRAIARILYAVFFLNSRRRGDLLIALARTG
jgi:SAM-dependent methyltransferase